MSTLATQRTTLSHGLRRLQAHLGGAIRIGRLYVDPSLAGLPTPILECAADIARTWPLALLPPGRLLLDGQPWWPRCRGRTALDVALLGPGGRPVGVGTVIEVVQAGDHEAWWHELVHATGVRDETTTARLGQIAYAAASRE